MMLVLLAFFAVLLIYSCGSVLDECARSWHRLDESEEEAETPDSPEEDLEAREAAPTPVLRRANSRAGQLIGARAIDRSASHLFLNPADYYTGPHPASIRSGFLRKLFGTVTAQVLFVAVVALSFMYYTPLTTWIFLATAAAPAWSIWPVLGACILTLLGCFCFKSEYPINYLCLLAFTLTMAVTIGVVSAVCKAMGYEDVILQALLYTSVYVAGFTLAAAVGGKAAKEAGIRAAAADDAEDEMRALSAAAAAKAAESEKARTAAAKVAVSAASAAQALAEAYVATAALAAKANAKKHPAKLRAKLEKEEWDAAEAAAAEAAAVEAAAATVAAEEDVKAKEAAAKEAAVRETARTEWARQARLSFDFLMVPLLLAALLVVVAAITGRLLQSPLMHTVYCYLGTLGLCVYIVIDTKLICERQGYDDYIVAAIEIYLDIMNVFVWALGLPFRGEAEVAAEDQEEAAAEVAIEQAPAKRAK